MFTNSNSFIKTFFVFYDVESTSKIPTEDDIISIGAVACEYKTKFVSLGTFHTYVSTRRNINPAAQAVHHITKAHLASAPSFPDAMRQFETWVGSFLTSATDRTILVAHNGTKFDDIILFCNCAVHGFDFHKFMSTIRCYGFMDTLKFLRTVFKGRPLSQLPKDQSTSRISFALGHCYTSFCGQVPLENAHDALVDSKALVEVMNSPSVQSDGALQGLFNYVVPREKAVKCIQDTVGMNFHRRVTQTILLKTQPNTILCEAAGDSAEEHKLLPVTHLSPALQHHEPTHGPTMHQVHFKQLCLKCMTFNFPEQHPVCM